MEGDRRNGRKIEQQTCNTREFCQVIFYYLWVTLVLGVD